MMNAQDYPSTRPYLIRALYEWCTDNGFTPYLVVRVNDSVQVPRDYVNNGEIVLNVSYEATSGLQLGNDFIEFKARFGGKPCDLLVPVHRVIAIYARENGQGMAFPLDDEGGGDKSGGALTRSAGAVGPERPPVQLQSVDRPAGEGADKDTPQPPHPSGGGRRPALKRIK
ncbi:MAG: ClpXP protease specificity-enhancing factor [Comamonadaceae bacterium]|nr:ClpXP protease specificity-enhancing factor [Pseudomonadota bacterium]MBS0610575.1 ClpXP protease specificity-enhancing factor [Pseudomonadota bacterium]MDE2414580.1 ClpXP protease specificity-enhancing factor [Comamonadaceae bacterium]